MDLPQRFYRKTRRWERFLYRSAAIVLALLIFCQILMVNSRARSLLNRIESLEGRPYPAHGGTSKDGGG